MVVGPVGVEEPVTINASAAAIPPVQDQRLLKAVTLAHYRDKQIDEGVVSDANDIAQRERMEVTRVRKVLRLVILDPQITLAILEGRQPRTLSLESPVRNSLPLDGEAQRRMVTEIGG